MERLVQKVAVVVVAALCFSGAARAENAACWGDNSRTDISCVKITEPLLLSFRGKSMAFVRKAMKAAGAERSEHGLHFLSNFDRGRDTGSGDVNVLFEDGRASIVNASVDLAGNAGSLQFIWNMYAAPPLGQDFDKSTRDFARPPYCSDLSADSSGCIGGSAERELTLAQVQFGLTKADLLKMLDNSCNPGQRIAAPDPNGDCVRIRSRLR
jgi:hypothetical protein